MLAACQTSLEKKPKVPDTLKPAGAKNIAQKQNRVIPKDFKVNPGEELIFQDEGIATFTESKRRGAGVISFDMAVHDQLRIYNEDGSLFGQIVLNDDLSYYTLDMPEKTVARKLIPEYDFAAFDFDAEPVESNDKYLKIYVNGKLRKVEKAQMKYTFRNWDEYLRDEKNDPEASENQ